MSGDLEIIQQRFIEAGGVTRPGSDAEGAVVTNARTGRSWTSHAVFVDAQDSEQVRKALAARSFRYVDLLPSQSPGGVWMLSGRHWLEQALSALEREPVI